MSYIYLGYFLPAVLAAGRKVTASALQALARRRRWAKARREINELDEHALRDLGVGSRSEFKSWFIESERLAQPALAGCRTVAAGKPVTEATPAAAPACADARRSRAPARTRQCEARHATDSHRKLMRGAHVAARP